MVVVKEKTHNLNKEGNESNNQMEILKVKNTICEIKIPWVDFTEWR